MIFEVSEFSFSLSRERLEKKKVLTSSEREKRIRRLVRVGNVKLDPVQSRPVGAMHP